ncbi:MAG TPA: shikimate kinase [Pyrinomonadaceae bacterium]
MSAPKQPIIITGFMAAGKTAVAQALAERLGCLMIDLDQLIAEREGRTAQAIIDEEGEQRFRELESQALSEALERTAACVIALGGGTWTIERNRALIAEHTRHTIWLDAPFELCWERIESENNVRPLARERERARQLYEERRRTYSQAGLRVKVDESASARTVAETIVRALALQTGGHDE